jgi:hypothetical protein
MQKDLYEFIIKELKAYKMNKAVLETLHNETSLGVSAQQLSEVPRSVTNKFSSMTENQAFGQTPDMEIRRDMKRVEIWLELISDEERYMISNFYIEGRTYKTIISNWRAEYTVRYWRRKRIQALQKVCESIEKSKK